MFFVLYIFLLILSIVGGAQLLIRYKKTEWLPHLLAISTGFIISIATLEFLPRLFTSDNSSFSSLFLVLGLSTFFIFDKYITPHLKFFNSEPSCKKSGCNTHDPVQVLSKKSSCQSISCLIVCSLFDGFQLGSSYFFDGSTQFYFALALFLHIAPSGALAASISLSGQQSDRFAFKSALLIATAVSLGLILSLFLNQQLNLFDYVLPFVGGVLLYNIFVHLLPTVIKQKSTLITMLIMVIISTFILH